MHDHPDKEWRRLTDLYASMYDEQLQELSRDFKDLTELAQQALRAEMQKRRLDDPSQPNPSTFSHRFAEEGRLAAEGDHPGDAGADHPPEYTWKTDLCGCEDFAHAWQLRETLRRAGIESWIDLSSEYQSSGRGPRVQVPADQLEEARLIAAQPIPEDVVHEFNTAVPEYEPPRCPHCGTDDPVLLAVEPTNTWGCEACGQEWAEREEATGGTRP